MKLCGECKHFVNGAILISSLAFNYFVNMTLQAERCEKWIKEAVSAGASVAVGGTRDGVFVDATILEVCIVSS